MTLPDAAACRYWKTSRRNPDRVLDDAIALVERVGGHVHERAMVMRDGREMIAIGFSIGDDAFRIVWPVLPAPGEEGAARLQAAAFIYHDMKAAVARAEVFGPRVALLPWLCPDEGGRPSDRPLYLHASPESVLRRLPPGGVIA